MAKQEVTLKFGLLFALLAILVKVVALAIPWWAYTETDFFGSTWKSNLGLWKWCREVTDGEGDSTTVCRSFSSPEDYVVTSRCLIVFALLLFFLGLVVVAAQHWFLQELIFLGFLGPLVMCVASVLTWVATVTYVENYVKTPGNHPHDVHAGWMLALSSAVFCFVSGILLAARKLCRK